MSSQPIKSFITIHNIDQTTRLDSATNEQVVNSYQCTEPAAATLASLVEQARTGSVAIITGVRGVGKSHLLAFLRAVITQPDLIQKVSHPFARKILEKSIDKKPRSQTMVTMNCDSEQTDVNLLSTRGDAQIEAACATGKNVFVFIDGLSLLLRRSKREECLQWLVRLAANADDQRYQLFITLDQDLIEILLRAFSDNQIISAKETIPSNNLALVLDQFICPKKPEQKRALDNLYDELRRKVPHFQWSHQEFLQAFPLHPQILELAPALRTYARTFSLLSFFYTVAPRAIMRRGFNLISLVEVFDTFEYDLRRNTALSYLFITYDYLLDNFVKALPSTQQLHGKFLLRAITLLSLAEKPFTVLEIADSVMIFDDSPAVLFRQSMKTIMDFMATAASEKMIISLADGEKKFQLCLAEASAVDPIQQATQEIEDDDSRLIEVLIDSGKENFKEWPLTFLPNDNSFQRRAELELIWRGTARRGILKLGGSTEISSNNSKQRNLEWQLTLVSPSSLDQYRTEVPENLVVRYWYPTALQPEELLLLKRLLVIRQQGHSLLSPEELQAEDSYLTSQAGKIFSRCYLEQGSLGNSQPSTAQTFSYQEKRLPNLLGQMLDPILKNKFSYHPNLGDLLNERTLRVLARGFFYQSEWSRPELKKYLGQFALPLHIVSLVGENFEFAMLSDIPKDSPLGKILSALERSYARTINRSDIERLLCNEPFGLQQTLLLLLVLGAAAAGHIILTDNEGEVILTSAGIRSGYDVASYTKVCLPSILQPQEEEPIPSLPLKTESRFNSLQENVLHDAVAEVLSATPTTKELPSVKEDEEHLLQFYQSGFFPRPAIGNEPIIKASTTVDSPSITRLRKSTTGEAAKVPAEDSLAEPIESGEEDELLEFYQSGSFQRPLIPEELEKPIEKTPVKLTHNYLRPPTENPKPLQEILSPKRSSYSEDSSLTPLVISKSMLESDLTMQESEAKTDIENLSLSSSNNDISAFANTSNVNEEFSEVASEVNSEFSIESNIESKSEPYKFDFGISDSDVEVTPPINSLAEETIENSNAEIAANSLLANQLDPFNNNSYTNQEVNLGQESEHLESSETNSSLELEQSSNPIEEALDFSSFAEQEPKQEADINALTNDLSLEPQMIPPITEDGKFEFDLDLPKPPVKTTVDIEKALASFEAERDRLANAPTLSELPIIDDIPDPDPSILDLDLSSEALKETRKIPIMRVPANYLETSHDSFESISPNHPTVKLPAVEFLDQEDDIEEKAKERLKQFAELSEINKITTKLPSLQSLSEDLDEDIAPSAASIEPTAETTAELTTESAEPIETDLAKTITEAEIEADDIYLDPFTGVFEAITFPDEEESKIPASLLVNKFATQASLPTVTQNPVQPIEANETQSAVEAVENNFTTPTSEPITESDSSESSIDQELASLSNYEKEKFLSEESVNIAEEEVNPIDTQSASISDTETATSEEDFYQEPVNSELEATYNEAQVESSQVNNASLLVNKLLDVSLDLDDLNNLVISEQNTEEIKSNQIPNPGINKSALDFITGKSTINESKNASLFTPQSPSNPIRHSGEMARLPLQESPSILPPETKLTGEHQALPPAEFSPLSSPLSPPRITGEQAILSPFGFSPINPTPLPSITDQQAINNPFSNPVALPKGPIKSDPFSPAPVKSLGDLLLGNTDDVPINNPINTEPSPIEYVPDEFVFGERSFNTPAPVKHSVIETLPNTTLSAESLPNEIVLETVKSKPLSAQNIFSPRPNDISLPTVSNVLDKGLANKWASPETESDFGFDTIMDDTDVEGLNMLNSAAETVPSPIKQFAPMPAPSAIPLINPIQYSSITQSPSAEIADSPMAAKISTPSINPNATKNQLVMSRKFNNEIIAGRELAILYEKFVEVCQVYKAPVNMPSEDQFRVTVLNISKTLKVESLSSEILCSLEIVEGEVHVYCQANRSSLFQKRSDRQRVF